MAVLIRHPVLPSPMPEFISSANRIWRTTSSFRAQSPWRAKRRLVSNVRNGLRGGASGENRASHPAQGAGRERAAIDDGICDHWAFFHAAPRDFSGSVEPHLDQWWTWQCDLNKLDPGAWSCPDFWVDRDIHSGHWLLFDSQDDRQERPAGSAWVDCVAALDFRRPLALGLRLLSSLLAHVAADFSYAG